MQEACGAVVERGAADPTPPSLRWMQRWPEKRHVQQPLVPSELTVCTGKTETGEPKGFFSFFAHLPAAPFLKAKS